MKMNNQRAGCGKYPKQVQVLQNFSAFICLLLGIFAFYANNASAAQLIWDAGNTNNGATIDSASGAWDLDTTTNLNWNNGSGNVSWTQTGTTAGLNGAIFSGPDAAPGSYVISLDSGTQMAVTNLQINANGYVFTDNGNTANTLFINTALNPPNPTMLVASGKSVTFSNRWFFPNNNSAKAWQLGTSGAASSASFFGAIGGEQILFTSTNGSTFWLAGASAPSVVTINADVRQTNGTFTTTGFSIGRPGGSVNLQPTAGATNAPASFTLDGPSTVMTLATSIQMGRNTKGSATVNVQNGATVNMASGANHIQISTDNQSLMQMTFNMFGGTLNLGTGSSSINSIWFYKSGVNAGGGGTATFNQTGGVVNAWGGIQFGIASGTVINSGVAALTNSGGFLYIGPGGSIGISKFANTAATNYITLSGGTVGALGGWISSMPMTLATLNGNITFQTADSGGSPWSIGLSGALTGPGGFYKTGGGTLTLSGANNYSGSTVVSNGTLKIVPALSPTNGSLTLDGSAGSPVLSLVPSSVPQSLTLNGDLTFANGTPTADFNFGGFTPSTSIAPIQVLGSGNVAFTATPNITVEGTAIPAGTYPLISYAGAVSGTMPTTPASLPASTSGYITNIVATKTIALVVTASPVSADYVWAVGSGNWDLVTKNWIRLGILTNYTDVAGAAFNDAASGPFPVTIANTTAVTPPAVKVTSTNAYTISGPGTIAGASTTVSKAGSGALTLAGTNTYAGGTTVIGGQLNINFGGSSTLNSAIGTGPLTLDLGSKVDNTSGQSVTLQPTIVQNWLDDWTYLGSTNFDTGLGTVTLGSSIVTLNVVSNTLAVSGPIGDGGNTYKIQKAGNGTLTLRVDNSFAGGLELVSGQVNLGSANCLGNGVATFDGGTIDNVSGADMTLSGVLSYSFPVAVNGTFTYLGTSNNLDLGGATVAITTGASQNWNIVSNTLTLEGDLLIGNATITKIGNGTLAVIGVGTAAQSSFIVNQGELDAQRVVGVTFGAGGSGHGFQVQSNAVVKLLPGGNGNQILNGFGASSYIVPILNAGGVLDMDGSPETVDGLAITNGVLRNSNPGTIATLTVTPTTGIHGTNAVILGDVNNRFDVPTPDAELDIAGEVTGSGSLVKTGLGIVNLLGINSYTGNTTISNGTLVLNSPFLSTNSTVTVNTNAALGLNGVLTLNFANSETNTISVLTLGGVSQPAGIYNATTDPTYLSGTGSLQVTPLSTINPLPGPIQVSVSGSTLALSWPTNLGWILQDQTNSLSTGLTVNSNAWFDVSGSVNVTSTNIPINPANPTVFFRLRHP